jgi:NADH:ubiquinone oxidoreductase subunit 6 (subunit J)
MSALLAICLWTVAAAVLAFLQPKILHSVLLLTLAWMGIAAFYLFLGAEFAAFAQVLVYLGAITMAVLFALLLTRTTRDDPVSGPGKGRGRVAAAVLTGAAVGFVLLWAGARAPMPAGAPAQPSATVREIGLDLMGPEAASLLVAGVFLTAALVGAVVLAADDGGGKGGGP